MFVSQAVLVALSLVQFGFATPTPAITFDELQLRSYIAFNEREVTPFTNETHHVEQLRRRAESWSATHPGLQEQIDSAVHTTSSKTHFFWSGRMLPALSEDDSVMLPTQKIAQQRGGTTLELTTKLVVMPSWGGGDKV